MERRELPRIAINNVTVRFKKLSPATFWSRLSPPSNLKDLSKSGLSFTTDFPVKKGEKIYLKLLFTDGQTLPLKGIVKWLKEIQDEGKTLVGVQFLPFGQSSDYNELNSLDYLRKLLPYSREGHSLSDELNDHLQ